MPFGRLPSNPRPPARPPVSAGRARRRREGRRPTRQRAPPGCLPPSAGALRPTGRRTRPGRARREPSLAAGGSLSGPARRWLQARRARPGARRAAGPRRPMAGPSPASPPGRPGPSRIEAGGPLGGGLMDTGLKAQAKPPKRVRPFHIRRIRTNAARGPLPDLKRRDQSGSSSTGTSPRPPRRQGLRKAERLARANRASGSSAASRGNRSGRANPVSRIRAASPVGLPERAGRPGLAIRRGRSRLLGLVRRRGFAQTDQSRRARPAPRRMLKRASGRRRLRIIPLGRRVRPMRRQRTTNRRGGTKLRGRSAPVRRPPRR